MRPRCIVIESPFFDRMTRVKYRRQCVLVQELVAKYIIKALDASILRWFHWIDEVLRDSTQSCPFKHLVAGDFTPVIRFKVLWQRTTLIAMYSREKSSTIVSARNRRPVLSVSETKSSDQRSFGFVTG